MQWHIESGALAVLRAQGLTSEILKVGDRVRILGDNSLRGRPEMFARNILLASGEEVMLTLGASPWFSTRDSVAMRAGSFDEAAIAKARAEADGIFRVWSQVEADHRLRLIGILMLVSTLPLPVERAFGKFPSFGDTRSAPIGYPSSSDGIFASRDHASLDGKIS